MAQKTTSARKLTRAEVADLFRHIADEFDDRTAALDDASGAPKAGEDGTGDGGDDELVVSVPVGNKTVALSPTESVDCDVTVIERSSMLRGDRESIAIELDWRS